MKSALLSLSLFSVVAFASTGNASRSSGQVDFISQSQAMIQVQTEFMEQQNWLVSNIWEDYGVEVSVKTNSVETMKQLRELHQALKNNQPIQREKFSLIIIACRRGHAACG